LRTTVPNNFTVGGVYKDFPKNSIIGNFIYHRINEFENLNEWRNKSYELWVRLDSPENCKAIIENFHKELDLDAKDQGDNYILRMAPLPEIHFDHSTNFDSTPKSPDKQTLFILLTIACVMLIVAGINFTNFSAAMASKRIKGINVKKIFGASVAGIRRELLAEAIIICILSYLVSLVIVNILRTTSFTTLVDVDISLSSHPLLLLIVALIAVLLGVLAGLYPAIRMTSFPVVTVLTGNFGLSSKGRKMRNLLTGVQFIASFALITAAAFIYLQNNYMKTSDTGYQKNELIITNITRRVRENKEAFANKLKSFANIYDVTFAEKLLSADSYMGWGKEYKGTSCSFQVLPVDPTFLDVTGIKLADGRNFRPEDIYTKHGTLIFNECARNKFEMKIGDRLEEMEIIGFMDDIKFYSFHSKVIPMAFYVWGTENWGTQPVYAYIRINSKSDMTRTKAFVQETLKEFDSDNVFDVRSYDDILSGVYEKEEKLGMLIALFSLAVILIAMAGVFGMVVFDSEYRRKEIGIRKTFGASVLEILLMFNNAYIRILCLCFVIAAPVSYFVISRWLENFAYKIPLSWWVFVIAGLPIFIITIATVTWQSYKAATINPIEAIKN
jgi:putative ABC transport system permease protein